MSRRHHVDARDGYRLAERLSAVRAREGVSQAYFADLFRVSIPTYRIWETVGPKNASTALFISLALRRIGDRQRWRAWKRNERKRRRQAREQTAKQVTLLGE